MGIIHPSCIVGYVVHWMQNACSNVWRATRPNWNAWRRSSPRRNETYGKHVGVFLFPSLARLLVSDYLQKTEHTGGAGRGFEALTDREREVLALIAQGRSNQEIADALVISIKTVNRHRENIMAKLNLHSRVELVRYAIEKGLIELT
jgi:DNA-binding CsgD family transcriptional regulator